METTDSNMEQPNGNTEQPDSNTGQSDSNTGQPDNNMEQEDNNIHTPSIWNRLYANIRGCLIPTGVIAVLWLGISWIAAAGVHGIALNIVAFLTDAFNGNDKHFIGGTVGKTLYVMCINNLFVSVAVSKRSAKEKIAAFFDGMKDDIISQIPQYGNFKFFFKDKDVAFLGSGVLGVGFALLFYPLITSGGRAVNTFVCLLLAAVLLKGVAKDKGLVMVITHLILGTRLFKRVRRTAVDRFISGMALGMALCVPVAFCSGVEFLRIFLGIVVPWLLVAGGLFGIYFKQLKSLWNHLTHRNTGGNG